ncbi:SubName: Full=Uncharacterized protein {ECO:0000313/EMBL:CCA69009.1} [Serendipita indica DSM 11827]|uniref:NAD-dependent epimerase/dehydratase domain-containing protein n=1 Tax=Serendipita indica (strain DSM 11827) TaxID=1109443 RepID=G4TCG6_SERID|nr:SubName: Full=Uncharacterized protein {ECO:0000313/EMBL:CCA69009.1} [Serendipita indica DSM 11827]CCA69009.1 hypothetical protein PIIN_02868 [Serendipita indica DSM 11827]
MQVFILGATGSIGGALLPLLRQEYPSADITALVRKDSDAPVLAKFGVKSVKGSAEKLELVTELSSKADLIINTADADIFDAVKAILDGAKRRYEATGKKSIFINISGVAVTISTPEGVFRETSQVYDDRDSALTKGLPDSAPHRNVENLVTEADVAGYVAVYTLSPATVYGASKKSSITRQTLLAKVLLATVKQSKKVHIVGEGSNLLNFVHVDDVASGYLTVIKHAFSGNDTESGYGRYYWVGGEQVPWIKVAKAYAKEFHAKGIADSDEPVQATPAEDPMMGFFGCNVRVVPGRLQDLGWSPVGSSIFDNVENDIRMALEAQ